MHTGESATASLAFIFGSSATVGTLRWANTQNCITNIHGKWGTCYHLVLKLIVQDMWCRFLNPPLGTQMGPNWTTPGLSAGPSCLPFPKKKVTFHIGSPNLSLQPEASCPGCWHWHLAGGWALKDGNKSSIEPRQVDNACYYGQWLRGHGVQLLVLMAGWRLSSFITATLPANKKWSCCLRCC